VEWNQTNGWASKIFKKPVNDDWIRPRRGDENELEVKSSSNPHKTGESFAA